MYFFQGTSTERSKPRAFNTPEISDIVIYDAVMKPYHCSKFVLSSKSDKFKEIISKHEEDATKKTLCVDHVRPETLEFVLCHLHEGESKVGIDNFLSVKPFATEFGVSDLVEMCLLYENDLLIINAGNCCQLLREALEFKRHQVITRCEDFMARNGDLLVERPDFLSLPSHIIQELLQFANTLFYEYNLSFSSISNLMKCIGQWMDHNSENEKEALGILEAIPVGLCSQYEIVELLSTNFARQNPQVANHLTRELSVWSSGLLTEPWGSQLEKIDSDNARGSWKKWEVPVSGWYYIVAKGGKGFEYKHARVMSTVNGLLGKPKTSLKTAGGGLGAVVGASFYLHEGDKVKVLAGRTLSGGGSTCIALLPKRPGFKPFLLIIAGGGGGAGLSKSGQPAALENEKKSNDCEQQEATANGDPSPDLTGSSCGSKLLGATERKQMSGSCHWCDGGKGQNESMSLVKYGGGGSGYQGGSGDIKRGGTGGSSFISTSAVNAAMFVGHGGGSGAKIYNGRDVPKGCFSSDV